MEKESYLRPKTRGELRDELKEGVSCEVVSWDAENTSMLIQGWLEFDAFTTKLSHNEGWTVFKPTVGVNTILKN